MTNDSATAAVRFLAPIQTYFAKIRLMAQIDWASDSNIEYRWERVGREREYPGFWIFT